jgi:2-keto-4-pentenoate hydratase/2-oxohepta-3-ene-1,7-dioic acid hydratase in catechol pathway
MRWVRARHGGDVLAGVVVGAGDGGQAHALRDVTVLGLVATGGLAEAARRAQEDPDVVVPLTAVELLAPIETPPSIRDFMAFEQHVAGMGLLAGARPTVPDVWRDQPLFYFSNPASLVGPYDDVAMPPGCEVFDFELEVAAVVGPHPDGLPLRDLTPEESAACLVGYVLLNDWSARDLQMREMQGPLGPCKGKDSAITLGPWLLSADELPGLAGGVCDVELQVDVGERFRGRDRLDSMAWTFAELAAYASRGTELRPGDLLGSGTAGDGCLAERWGRQGRESVDSLHIGETVRLDGGPLGSTASRVVGPAPVRAPLRRRAG